MVEANRSWSFHGIAEKNPTLLVHQGKTFSNLVLIDPQGEANQSISSWIADEVQGRVEVTFQADKIHGMTIKITFFDLDEATRFKMTFGDYLIVVKNRVVKYKTYSTVAI